MVYANALIPRFFVRLFASRRDIAPKPIIKPQSKANTIEKSSKLSPVHQYPITAQTMVPITSAIISTMMAKNISSLRSFAFVNFSTTFLPQYSEWDGCSALVHAASRTATTPTMGNRITQVSNRTDQMFPVDA